MAKKKKVKLREHTGNKLHIEFPKYLGENKYIKTYIILHPITSITIFGEDNTNNFEWEGSYGTEKIRVSLPRSTGEDDATITGNFPNEIDEDRGTTYEQLYKEIRRVLRQLD